MVEAALRAIEVMGSIDEHRQLHLDEPLPVAGPSRVRVIILIPDAGDMDEQEWLRAAATNPAFDFLKDLRRIFIRPPMASPSVMKSRIVLVPFPLMTAATSLIHRDLGVLSPPRQAEISIKLRRLFGS